MRNTILILSLVLVSLGLQAKPECLFLTVSQNNINGVNLITGSLDCGDKKPYSYKCSASLADNPDACFAYIKMIGKEKCPDDKTYGCNIADHRLEDAQVRTSESKRKLLKKGVK